MSGHVKVASITWHERAAEIEPNFKENLVTSPLFIRRRNIQKELSPYRLVSYNQGVWETRIMAGQM